MHGVRRQPCQLRTRVDQRLQRRSRRSVIESRQELTLLDDDLANRELDSVLGFYKRRLRDVAGVVGQSGAVSVVQRVDSDLRLNPHLHVILLDGVFAAEQGSPVFHPLSRLDDSDLADLLQVIRVRLLNFLLRISPIVNSHFGASGSLVSVIGIGAKRRGLVDELVSSL